MSYAYDLEGSAVRDGCASVVKLVVAMAWVGMRAAISSLIPRARLVECLPSVATPSAGFDDGAKNGGASGFSDDTRLSWTGDEG